MEKNHTVGWLVYYVWDMDTITRLGLETSISCLFTDLVHSLSQFFSTTCLSSFLLFFVSVSLFYTAGQRLQSFRRYTWRL